MALVYLAGPIRDISYEECTHWRKEVQQELLQEGITGISPMRGKEFLSEQDKLDFVKDDYKEPLATPGGITTRDRFDVMWCDLLLVNLLEAERVSVGTVLELGWADILRKPVILVMEEDNPHQHPMIREVAGIIVEDLDQAVGLVKTIFSPTLKT